MTTKRRTATVLAAASLMLSALAAPALAGKPGLGDGGDSPDQGGACEKLGGTDSGKDCTY